MLLFWIILARTTYLPAMLWMTNKWWNTSSILFHVTFSINFSILFVWRKSNIPINKLHSIAGLPARDSSSLVLVACDFMFPIPVFRKNGSNRRLLHENGDINLLRRNFPRVSVLSLVHQISICVIFKIAHMQIIVTLCCKFLIDYSSKSSVPLS